jgi:subtilase family serine protease
MPVSGGSVHEIIGFSSLPPAAGQNQPREITVIADSDNKIKETNEGNNAITLQGTCPG